ncbi:MAG: molybdopterin-synthase adenylyltransferase MoeB [Anaerolineae bacterium]|nr:molybdopterin-synthase adenylyltransferase MoeB [Anaerolineae bacterium]NUQ03220.1 molybdopterin-synthase adenylyltransferase MoeB [Anaerolineae bacterium]
MSMKPIVSDLGDLSNDEIRRYGRHLIMPEFGMEAQRRLKASSVLIVGTGGLGSPLALYLAAAGVGRLGLVDYDIVDESNLQRQIIHGQSTVGVSKTESAERRLNDLNPFLEIVRYDVPLTSDNALEIIAPYDLVIDGTDNFPTRYLVNDACVKLGKPNVYGSILRFEGQLSVFYAQEGPCYRCMFPEPPPPGLVPNCAEAGVLGVLPGTIGTMQATEAVKLLTGIGDPMIGRMLLYDALEVSFTTIKVRKNPKCPVCSIPADQVELIDYEEFCGVPAHDHAPAEALSTAEEAFDADAPVPQITALALKARLDQGESPVIIDVRNPPELEIAALENTVLIPKPQIMIAVDEVLSGRKPIEDTVIGQIPRDREVLFLCRSGVRSTDVIYALRDLGYHPASLINVEGGILAWAREVDASMPMY